MTDKRIDEEEQAIEKMKSRNKEVLQEIKRLRETVINK